MMIKFRELVNYFILNDEKVGFQGDSEYQDENGEIRMGYWSFLDIFGVEYSYMNDYFTLDDEIDDSELLEKSIWKIKNDNGVICLVEIVYNDYDEDSLGIRDNYIIDEYGEVSSTHFDFNNNPFESNNINLPNSESCDDNVEKDFVAHFTNYDWDWYVLHGYKQSNGDYMLFGLVDGWVLEYGWFSLSELVYKHHIVLNKNFKKINSEKLYNELKDSEKIKLEINKYENYDFEKFKNKPFDEQMEEINTISSESLKCFQDLINNYKELLDIPYLGNEAKLMRLNKKLKNLAFLAGIYDRIVPEMKHLTIFSLTKLIK
ncbi:hypothetical protein [Methanobrevibacter sp.]|uniref:hypothetical protein n=1 Tax=Methanobrevibacter sp. TaxID=66852 RepID=UPI00386A9267